MEAIAASTLVRVEAIQSGDSVRLCSSQSSRSWNAWTNRYRQYLDSDRFGAFAAQSETVRESV
jgi:hypothetical protein